MVPIHAIPAHLLGRHPRTKLGYGTRYHHYHHLHHLTSRPLPLLLSSLELSGTVVAVGPLCSRRLRAGDRVAAVLDDRRPGALAEFAVVREELVANLPPTMTFAQAAASPLAAMRASLALNETAASITAVPGHSVLVLGAGNPLGLATLQLASHLGATTIIAVGRQAAGAAVQGLGIAAEFVEVENLRSSGLDKVKASLSGQTVVDVVVDCVGGEGLWLDGRSLVRPGGAFVTFVGDDNASPLQRVRNQLLRNLWSDVTYADHSLTPHHSGSGLQRAIEQADSGVFRIAVAGLWVGLERAATALAAVRQGELVGKALLVVGSEQQEEEEVAAGEGGEAAVMEVDGGGNVEAVAVEEAAVSGQEEASSTTGTAKAASTTTKKSKKSGKRRKKSQKRTKKTKKKGESDTK